LPTLEVYPGPPPPMPPVTVRPPFPGPPRAPLGTSVDSVTPPPSSGRRSGRSERHSLKAVQRKVSHSKSSRQCWYPSASKVVVDVGWSLEAHVSNVFRCGSSWSCPVCAPVIRARRAEEIDRALSEHLANGGGSELLTLTVAHQRGDQLLPRLKVMAQAVNFLLTGSGWGRRRRRLGYIGSIRAIEITRSYANGWHPHLHVLVLFDAPLSESARLDLHQWLFARWNRHVTGHGFGSLHEVHGVDLRPVTGSGDLAGYLTKVENGWSAGAELARSHLKNGRAGSLSPFDLLRDLADTGSVDALRLWQEYEEATFALRSLRWSPGLRARLLPAEPEQTDDELAAAASADAPLVRALVDAMEWRRALVAGATGPVLDQIEAYSALALLLVMQWGHQPKPLEVVRREPSATKKGTARAAPALGPDVRAG
jgi:hypothetical protein